MTEQTKLKIKQNKRKTIQKHKSMQCHVYKVKIQYNKLNKLQQQQLNMLFVEGKWLYNYLLSQENVCKIKISNIKSINHYDKNKNEIQTQIRYLKYRNKQQIHNSIKSSIKSLATKKKRKQRIGKLNYISQLKAINIPRFNHDYFINFNNSTLHIVGIEGYIKANGLNQIREEYQLANARLLNKPTGYYLAITTYRKKQNNINIKPSIGIDFGCTNSFTLSNGQKFKFKIEETERLKRLQTKLISKKKNSNNRIKLISKIRKQYEHINNKKNDQANKFINYLINNYSIIAIQNEQISGWQKTKHGKAIQHSILGRVKTKLIKMNNIKVINESIPTTKTCSNCGFVRQINLYQRTYQCPNCGLIIDRDINSAMNILNCSQINLTTIK